MVDILEQISLASVYAKEATAWNQMQTVGFFLWNLINHCLITPFTSNLSISLGEEPLESAKEGKLEKMQEEKQEEEAEEKEKFKYPWKYICIICENLICYLENGQK